MLRLLVAGLLGALLRRTWGPSNPPAVGSGQANLFAVTTPAFPNTTVFQQNTTGVDVVAYVKLASVTYTHAYVGPAASATGAVDVLNGWPASATAATSAAMVVIPNGYYFSMTYSGGTPTWVWAGLI